MYKKWKFMGLLLLLGIFLLFCLSGLKQSNTVFINIRSDDGEAPVITAHLTSGETSVSIDAWCSDTGEYYLFLPSWAEGRIIQTEAQDFRRLPMKTGGLFLFPFFPPVRPSVSTGDRRSPF